MALSPITINGQTILQPSTLREYKEATQSEQYAIDGAAQRNRVKTTGNPNGEKAWAEMTWDKIPPSDFLTLYNSFRTGSGICYQNPSSKYGTLTFSGLPFMEEGEYVSGESRLTTFKVRIREQ